MDYDKAATAAQQMPWHAPPGLDISTSGLNFADLKIDGFPPDGIPKVINYKGERWKVRKIFVSLSILHYFCIVTKQT